MSEHEELEKKRQAIEAALPKRHQRTLDEMLASWRAGRVALPEPPAPSKLSAQETQILMEAEFVARMGAPKSCADFRRAHWSESFDGRRTPWPTKIDTWDDEWCLALTGPPGTGKTCAAIAIAIAHMYKWKSKVPLVGVYPRGAAFVSVVDACATLQRHYEADQDLKIGQRTAPEHYEHIMRTSALLILDDVGAQPKRGNWTERVDGWIHGRHERRQRTIFTMNEIKKQKKKKDWKPGDPPPPPPPVGQRSSRRIEEGLIVRMP